MQNENKNIISMLHRGHRASKLPYDEKSKEHERLENVLYLKDHIGGTANLNLVLPYKDIEKGFTELQRDNFNWIKRHAKTVKRLHRKYTNNCYRERNQYMVDKSDYLIAMQMPNDRNSGTQMMAREKGIEIRIVDPITYDVEIINVKNRQNLL